MAIWKLLLRQLLLKLKVMGLVRALRVGDVMRSHWLPFSLLLHLRQMICCWGRFRWDLTISGRSYSSRGPNPWLLRSLPLLLGELELLLVLVLLGCGVCSHVVVHTPLAVVRKHGLIVVQRGRWGRRGGANWGSMPLASEGPLPTMSTSMSTSWLGCGDTHQLVVPWSC